MVAQAARTFPNSGKYYAVFSSTFHFRWCFCCRERWNCVWCRDPRAFLSLHLTFQGGCTCICTPSKRNFPLRATSFGKAYQCISLAAPKVFKGCTCMCTPSEKKIPVQKGPISFFCKIHKNRKTSKSRNFKKK